MIWAWFVKFFSGFAIWKGQQFGKFLFFSIIAFLVCFTFWKAYVEKRLENHTVVQSGGTVNNTYLTECKQKTPIVQFKLWKIIDVRLGSN